MVLVLGDVVVVLLGVEVVFLVVAVGLVFELLPDDATTWLAVVFILEAGWAISAAEEALL